MDSFFGIGLFELVMIAVVALLVLGPERLPGAMREVAKWIRQLRSLSGELQSQFSEEFKLLDELNPRRIINEALDPNAPSVQPKPGAAPAAKPPAAKPPLPAPKPAAAVTATAAIANGEPQNTILPPPAAAETSAAQTPAEPASAEPAPIVQASLVQASAAQPAQVMPAASPPALSTADGAADAARRPPAAPDVSSEAAQ